jgi:hypothetical protein
MDLKKLSKKALEAIGRDKGIELDRRLKKDKLVEELQGALDAEKVAEKVKPAAVEEVSPALGRDKSAWVKKFKARHQK